MGLSSLAHDHSEASPGERGNESAERRYIDRGNPISEVVEIVEFRRTGRGSCHDRGTWHEAHRGRHLSAQR